MYAVAWPVGRVLGGWVFEGTVTDVGTSTTWADVQPVATSHWLPGVVFLAAAVVVLLASALSARRWRVVVAAASATAGLGVGAVFLEVDENNAAARKLYQRAGFETVGRREGYYATQFSELQ